MHALAGEVPVTRVTLRVGVRAPIKCMSAQPDLGLIIISRVRTFGLACGLETLRSSGLAQS